MMHALTSPARDDYWELIIDGTIITPKWPEKNTFNIQSVTEFKVKALK